MYKVHSLIETYHVLVREGRFSRESKQIGDASHKTHGSARICMVSRFQSAGFNSTGGHGVSSGVRLSLGCDRMEALRPA